MFKEEGDWIKEYTRAKLVADEALTVWGADRSATDSHLIGLYCDLKSSALNQQRIRSSSEKSVKAAF